MGDDSSRSGRDQLIGDTREVAYRGLGWTSEHDVRAVKTHRAAGFSEALPQLILDVAADYCDNWLAPPKALCDQGDYQIDKFAKVSGWYSVMTAFDGI